VSLDNDSSSNGSAGWARGLEHAGPLVKVLGDGPEVVQLVQPCLAAYEDGRQRPSLVIFMGQPLMRGYL